MTGLPPNPRSTGRACWYRQGEPNFHIEHRLTITDADPPKDGDFAAYLERKQARPRVPPEALAEQPPPESASTEDAARSQSIEDILRGQEPTDEFIEEWNEAERNRVSDAELERQALEHPGADGDPGTPE